MEKYEIENDIKVICYTAESFPEGIKNAFDSLQEAVPECEKRTWYGISRPNDEGTIIYKAAVNELSDGEAAKFDLESFTITKGTYLAETIMDWMSKIESIGATFDRLLSDPLLDNNFPCIEWYKSDNEVVCMVRITGN